MGLRLFSRLRRSTRLRATRMSRQTRSSPDLAVALALPGRCLGRSASIATSSAVVRDRGLRSPTLCRRRPARRAGRRSWRRTRSGPCPRRLRPAAGRRPDPCRARWPGTHRRDLRRPAKGRSSVLASSSSTCMDGATLRSAAWRYPGIRLNRIALALLERRRRIPADRFLTPCSSRTISTPNWRDRSCTGSSRKSRRTTSRLRATVHRWPESRAGGRQSLAWGKRGSGELSSSPAFTTSPSTEPSSSQNYRCSASLGHFDLCPRTIGSDSKLPLRTMPCSPHLLLDLNESGP